MNVLTLEDISKKYLFAKKLALDDLNLSVSENSIFGFLGPNGAGKSTTINIIARLVKKDTGKVYFRNQEIKDGDYEYKRQVGFVLERPTYFEKLTVKEYLEFAGSMYDIEKNEIKKRAQELIEFLELSEKQNEWIEKYSAGMKKKVSLAAAIIHKPKLLILDEPLEGIDPISAKRIKDVLKQMVQNGTTVLITSHVLDTIEKLCDEIAIINKGKLVFQSKTEDIRSKIKNEITQETYQSLEEIFIDVVANKSEDKQKGKLSWL
ncbi:MAG: ABC transporter ATP-binding protein [Bacteroidetes bacterium]|nr:ABC transporter ATP-binding protein [Bacteroidota bacterium]